MTNRETIEAEFLKICVMIAEMEPGARGTLMLEHLVLCKQAVLEVFDGPEIPVRDDHVALTQFMKANMERDRLRKTLREIKKVIAKNDSDRRARRDAPPLQLSTLTHE